MTTEKEYVECQICGKELAMVRHAQPWMCSECTELEAQLEQARAEAREPLVQALRHCVRMLQTMQKSFSPRVVVYKLAQDALDHAEKALKTLEKEK